jgi:sporulation protein YlmC with PRC-barrel domain
LKVQTPTGESIGKVEDMVLDDSGRISQVIIDRSTAGAGERPATSRLAALPWSEVSSMIKADALVIERQRLANAQSYDETERR